MSGPFAAWGRVVHRHRLIVLAGSAVVLALSLVGLLAGGATVSGSDFHSSLQAQQASDLMTAQLPAQTTASGGTALLVFRSGDLAVSDAAYQQALQAAVAPLAADSRVASVLTPYDVPEASRSALVSRDGHEALVRVTLHASGQAAQSEFPSIRSEVRPGPLTVQATGQVPLNRAFSSTLENDLRRAESVSLPVTLLLLLLIFGSVMAALLPLGVGLLTIVGGLGGTLLLARSTDVSQYALNVVTLIGLGVSIDYSLFIVNRFREELAGGASGEDALATTLATAGRAITFSGLTVAIGLSALLFYQGTFMSSMGAAGAIVVGVAVLYALTFLPALLALLGPRVDRLRLRLPWRRRAARQRAGEGLWERGAAAVMRRPVLVLMPALALLLIAGSPFAGIRLANGDIDLLPPGLEARQAYDRLTADFPGYDQTTFSVVVNYGSGAPLTAAHAGGLYDLSQRIGALHGVLGVSGPVNLSPDLGRADYQRLLPALASGGEPSGAAAALPATAVQAVRASTGAHIAVLTVVSNLPASSDGARTLLKDLRAEQVPGATVLVTGSTAFDVDVINFILSRTPLAVAFVVAVTLVVLFLLTGSVVLPVKAVLTNLASITASFGALVWIFQQGHLSGLLDFTAQSLDPSIPVILFATVFGLSMDYEVLLVTRIQEEYRATGDNVRAIARGLVRSGRLITGAAAIMVVVFLAFGMAQVVIIKAIGIGLAIAIAVDATIVRALVVPSVMRLLGDANWWAPGPLRALHRLAGMGEAAPAEDRRAA